MKIRHLEDNNITYFKHMKRAFTYSFQSLKASCLFFIHGCLPCYLEYNGGQTIENIHLDITNHI